MGNVYTAFELDPNANFEAVELTLGDGYQKARQKHQHQVFVAVSQQQQQQIPSNTSHDPEQKGIIILDLKEL